MELRDVTLYSRTEKCTDMWRNHLTHFLKVFENLPRDASLQCETSDAAQCTARDPHRSMSEYVRVANARWLSGCQLCFSIVASTRDLLSGTGQVQQWHTRTHRQSPRPYVLSVASPSRYSGECCAHTHLAVCQLCFLLSLTYLTLFTLIDSVRMAFDISCWWGRWRTVKEKYGYFLP